MSTNPFRRSSFKGSNTNIPSSASIDIPDDNGYPLTVNTKVAVSSQKHVNFASPPAVPISPASYPSSSPESSRIFPAFPVSNPILPAKTDYSEAIQADPYRASVEKDEDDGVIEQALRTAKVNTDLATPDPQPEKEDAVKNTLSKFASGPRKPSRIDNGSTERSAIPARQSMDVDAFKRMLLTGNSGLDQSATTTNLSSSMLSSRMPSESSSNMDTASTSQRSILDFSRSTTEESSRSSDDGNATLASELPEERKKPPPPPSRRGRTVEDKPLPALPSVESISPRTPASPATQPANIETPKIPPPPPISRRRSQKSGISRGNSYQQSQASEQDSVGARSDMNQRAPPPPPTRRASSMLERRTSHDLPTTLEESDSTDTSAPPSRKASDSRPPPPPSRTSSITKRMSLGVFGAATPPLPPPRRGRGSSRSSIDSQRPSISVLTGAGNIGSARSSVEYSRGDAEGRTISAGPDILADLAALQREVDEARRSAGR